MKKGFTLLELIIVVIILGILVSIAIPQFTGTRLRAYSAEAMNLLGAMRSAQIRYFEQFSAYATICTNLDVGYTTLKYHLAPVCGTSAADVVHLEDNDTNSGEYILNIGYNGTVTCTNVGTSTDCGKLGY